jgi:hypothetical protein
MPKSRNLGRSTDLELSLHTAQVFTDFWRNPHMSSSTVSDGNAGPATAEDLWLVGQESGARMADDLLGLM